MFFIIAIQAAVFWQLCEPQPQRPTRPSHVQDYLDEYVKDHGKKFDPTNGFEPYWADGDWVFMEQKPKPNATTTRKPTLVCGDDCPYIYRKVKHVCARSTNNLYYKGCLSTCSVLNNCDWCWGDWIDDLTGGFHTFDTYCDFLNAQCRSPVHNKWTFLHSGKCVKNVDDYMKPIKDGDQLRSRVTYYFTELSKARASHSLPPIHFT